MWQRLPSGYQKRISSRPLKLAARPRNSETLDPRNPETPKAMWWLRVGQCVHHYLQLPNAVDIMMPKACEKRNVPPAFLNRILCKCMQYSGHRLWAVCVQTAVIFCVQLAVIACVLVACLFAFVACVFILCVRVCVCGSRFLSSLQVLASIASSFWAVGKA